MYKGQLSIGTEGAQMQETLSRKSTYSNGLIEQRLAAFKPISLLEMSTHNLQKRIDTKYLFTTETLALILPILKADFYILEIDDKRIQTYENLYFDTESYVFYNKHHNGHTNRYKVRKRFYRDSNLTFLEVKHKNNKSVTNKKRIRLPSDRKNIKKFITENLPKEYKYLVPVLRNSYKRISLISKEGVVRLTLDIDLSFSNPEFSNHKAVSGLAIAELKRSSHAKSESFERVLKYFEIKQSSFSKYCIGCSIFNHNLKKNRFKPILNQLRKFS